MYNNKFNSSHHFIVYTHNSLLLIYPRLLLTIEHLSDVCRCGAFTFLPRKFILMQMRERTPLPEPGADARTCMRGRVYAERGSV